MRIFKWSFAVLCCVAQSVLAQPASTNSASGPSVLPAPAPGALRSNAVNRFAPTVRPTRQVPQYKVMAWDSEIKDTTVTNGELSAAFIFNTTNIVSTNIIITGTHTSCGCTVAKLPELPWVLPPGSNGQIQVTVNLAGKVGTLTKTVHLFVSNLPPQMVTVKINIPPPPPMSDAERERNRQLSKVDAQAVFKGSCADCHLIPARGRMGAALYDTMCGVCHEVAQDRRASMVPNLHSLKKPTNYDFWREVITNGRTNTLMPAFAIANGGPLSDSQINSLAEYLARNISRNYRPAQVTASGTNKITPISPIRSIQGLQPLPPLKKLDAVQPPAPPIVPPVKMPTNSAGQ